MNNLERNCEGLTTKLQNYQVTSCFVPEYIIKLVIVGHQTMWHTRSVYISICAVIQVYLIKQVHEYLRTTILLSCWWKWHMSHF